ncbi:MAG: magnesium/cobalt transporter CorA [Bacteroidia bacterium]|nr:magnesium/cobalt transporter CorA [Bacteroidia bacterium]
MKRKRKLKKIDLHKFVSRTAKRGSIPGTVEYIGLPRGEDIRIDVLEYDESTIIKESIINSVEELEGFLEHKGIKWIQVTGVHNSDILSDIGKLFKIISLDLEDIANTTQRPRIEEREDYIFLVFKVLQLDPESREVNIEQVSIILGSNYVISFHETTPKIFETLHSRILTSKGRIRKMKSDYLVFSITDIIIDQYFTLLEDIGETIEETEEELILSPGQASQEAIYKLKRRLGYVKKTIWPAREVLSVLQRSDHQLIHDETRIYFRNNYDHTIQIIETLESLRDLTSGMMDLYLSTVSFKMNEIMKVLTIFSTIFIPLTFFAGVYGMNFKYLPELEWKSGYYIFWGIMISIILMMLLYFKRKKWF